MAGGNDKIKKLGRDMRGLANGLARPFLSHSPLWTFLSHLLSSCRGVDKEGLLVGHFDQLSSNNTILRGEHYTP